MRSLRSPTIDASLVAPNLWVGARPPPGHYRWLGVVALCAREFQPPSYAYPGMAIIRVPLDDDRSRPLTEVEGALAISNAKTLARYLDSGQRCMVTCAMGINRSAMIAALSMLFAFDMTADDAIQQIRETRSLYALNNRRFTEFIRRVERLRDR